MLAVAVTDPALSSEARHAKLREAETLLQESNKALQPSDTVPKHYKRDSFTRLVRLYEVWEKPDKAAEWRKKVEDFDKAK